MGQLEDLQAKGFGSHGGKEYTVEHDIKPLKKRVLVSDMHFGETKTKGGIILTDDDGSEGGIHPRWGSLCHWRPTERRRSRTVDHGITWTLEQGIQGQEKRR